MNNDPPTDPRQPPLFEERVSLDALFPGYRQWLANRPRALRQAVHSQERNVYDAWVQAVTLPQVAEEDGDE